MLRFAWADAKGAMRTAMLAFALTTCGLGVALAATVLLDPKRTAPLTAVDVVGTLLVTLWYAALPAMVVAAGAALFRLAGAWAFLPLLVFPAILYSVCWLARGELAAQGQDVLSALGTSLKENTWVFGILRFKVLELFIAALPAYGLYVALQPAVLLQLFQYLLLVGALVGAALLLTCIVTLPPLLLAVGRRMAWRYAKHVARDKVMTQLESAAGELRITRSAVNDA
jgi:hypothetical protein